MRGRSWVAVVLAAGALGAVVTCSISDENGEPALPGQYTPTGPGTTPPPVNPTANPAILVTGAQDIAPGDTLWLNVSLVDQNNGNRGIPSASITVRTVIDSRPPSYDTIVTNASGFVRIGYRDTTRGNVTVTFSYGSASRTVTFRVTPEPTPPQRLIIVRAEKSALPADGKSSTKIVVTVINKHGWPVVGQRVAFITTAGVIAGEKPPADSLSGVSVTDENGIARATLTSTPINDTAVITVFLLSDLSMSAETRVAFQGVHVNIAADTYNLQIGQDAIVTATLLNGSDEPIVQTPITFRLASGAASNFRFIARDTVTGFDGRAIARIRGTATGSDSVIVTAAGARAVLMLNVTSLKLTVWLNQTHLVSSDTASTILNIRFTDLNNNPLVGREVRIKRHYPSATGVPLVDSMTAYTNALGEDTVRIKGLAYDGTVRVAVTAYASQTSFATAEATLTVTTTRYLTIEALPLIIPADGSSGSQITVQVKNQQGNPIKGDTILFSTTAGIINGMAVTDNRGRAVDTLYSDRRNVTALVRAVLQRDITKTDSVTVVFGGVTITANAAPRSIRGNRRDTSFISIFLTDATGNPIPGEPVTFTPKRQEVTSVVWQDEMTDNRGQALCKVVGSGSGTDTIVIKAAGAEARPVIYYASNILTIDTLPGQPLIADGQSLCGIVVTYTTGAGVPLANVPIALSVTLGSVDSVYFAKTDTTNAAGRVTFYMRSPQFANTATVAAEATTSNEVTTATKQFYFRATRIVRITLAVTPFVINTNGDKATVTATAFDAMGNRVADELIAFNLIDGPGGGEELEPPTAVTRYDGTATTTLISGTIPSTFQEVKIVAGDFERIKSDTAKLTIAGPPYAIAVGYNVEKGINPNDGTFILPCAAIVSDVNGNPVADGTEVTFSVKITGYVAWRYGARFVSTPGGVDGSVVVNAVIDTLEHIIPFEDLNDNLRLDPGEDRNGDGVASRGEDYNGDGVYNPGPGFVDINRNGRRDMWPEPYQIYRRSASILDTAIAHFNGNGILDTIEPLRTSFLTWQEYMDSSYAYDPKFGFDLDVDGNGKADPQTTVLIKRTVQTMGGKAINQVTYVQSDANKIRVMILAEAQGVVTVVPAEVILPVIQ